jgi:quercetin dioxygenase-like cupin family protein
MDDGCDRISFLEGPISMGFKVREVTVAPGGVHSYIESEWTDALVAVERGEIEVECSGGSRRRFYSGDMLWLAGLPIRRLHNPGREPAVLAAVSRRRPAEPGGPRDRLPPRLL